MEADRREAEIKEPISDMERGSDEMEHRLDQLGDDIADARKTADQRQDAPSEKDGPDAGETAGDWEGEAAGASQGEDAEDAEDADGGEQPQAASDAQEQIDRGVAQRDPEGETPPEDAR